MKTIQKSKVETIRNHKTKPPTEELVRILITYGAKLLNADWL